MPSIVTVSLAAGKPLNMPLTAARVGPSLPFESVSVGQLNSSGWQVVVVGIVLPLVPLMIAVTVIVLLFDVAIHCGLGTVPFEKSVPMFGPPLIASARLLMVPAESDPISTSFGLRLSIAVLTV